MSRRTVIAKPDPIFIPSSKMPEQNTLPSVGRRRALQIFGLAGALAGSRFFPILEANAQQGIPHWTLQCLGSVHNPNHVFLDGRTVDGTVGLAPNTDAAYSGTVWRVYGANGTVGEFLECLGSSNAGKNGRLLNGNTYNGMVTLEGDPTLTGTRWQVVHLDNLDNSIIALKCLGNFANPKFQFLDGRTADGTVGLAPSTNEPYSGTRWKFTIVAVEPH